MAQSEVPATAASFFNTEQPDLSQSVDQTAQGNARFFDAPPPRPSQAQSISLDLPGEELNDDRTSGAQFFDTLDRAEQRPPLAMTMAEPATIAQAVSE